jgi:branched-chain amino acid transport system substrate-binding protein
MVKKAHPIATCNLQIATRFLLSFFLTFLSLLFHPGCHRKSSPEVVSFGHVDSFRGPDKLSGEHAKQGIELALQEAQGTDGTINDRRVEVIHVEETATPRLAIINKVLALVGGTNSAHLTTMQTVARSYETPLITSAGLPEPVSEFAFHTGLAPSRQAETLADFANKMEKPAIRRIAILTDGSEKGVSSFLAEKFTKEILKKNKTSLAGEWTYRERRPGPAGSEGERAFKSADDLKAIMNEIQSRKPDSIFLAGSASDLPRLQKAGLDEHLPILFAGEEGSDRVFQAAASNQPVYLVSAFALHEDDQQKEFVTEYEKRFHELPDVYAALAYDNMRILLEVLKRPGPPKGSKLKEAIEELRDFPTLTGKISFSKQDHWPERTAFVVRVQDGKSQVVHVKPVDEKKDDPSP